jgi:hypothetical protein
MPQPRKTNKERGLGWSHQKRRAYLLRVHVNGTPSCPIPPCTRSTEARVDRGRLRSLFALTGHRTRPVRKKHGRGRGPGGVTSESRGEKMQTASPKQHQGCEALSRPHLVRP